jgi:hypothetical protein
MLKLLNKIKEKFTKCFKLIDITDFYFIFFILTLIGILTFIVGCSKPQPQIKYIKIPCHCPKLNAVDLKDLNLSKDKPVILHLKRIEK